jgi:hypothetical protein
MGTDERDRAKRSDDFDELDRAKRSGDPDVEAHSHLKRDDGGVKEPDESEPDVEAHFRPRSRPKA